MLKLTDLSLMRGARLLYKGVNLLANDGERIGLVGPNGSGKSSLIAAILGEAPVESGEISAPGKAAVGHVAQDIAGIEEAAFPWVMAGHAPLMDAKKALKDAVTDMELAHAHAALSDLNEGAIEARASLILHGLGFAEADKTKPVSSFSGGWRNRLALARALMSPAELLLLDEPTNHLDMDSLIWLENFLKRQDCTTVIISHDREFLDKTVQTVWSIEDGTVRRYAGNFTDFERLRTERLRLQASQAKAYAEEARHLQAYIDRFRYKATKARQAQSRIKMLERLEAVEPVRAAHAWRFAFLKPERIPQHLITTENLTLSYGTKPVIGGATLSIRAMERIGVLGVNGAGKSTLIKGLTGELKPVLGKIYRGEGLKIGYFAQHELEALDPELSAYEHLRHKDPVAREQVLRDYLGRFKFSGEKINQASASLSGGEKARLALALLAYDRPNLLILDEPTNHLDMDTREALTMALARFEGSVVVVSHDRHLITAVCERLVLVHDGRVTEFEGDIADYESFVLAHRKAVSQAKKEKPKEAVPSKKEERRLAAQERQRIAQARKPLLEKLKVLEKSIEEIQGKLREADARLADEGFYRDGNPDEVSALLKERGEFASRLEAAEAAWLEVSEALESVE